MTRAIEDEQQVKTIVEQGASALHSSHSSRPGWLAAAPIRGMPG